MSIFFLSLVVVNPVGPLLLKINSTVTILCNATDPVNHPAWYFIDKNNSVFPVDYNAPGNVIRNLTASTSSLSFRVVDFSIIGIQCIEVNDKPGDILRDRGRIIHLLFQGMLILYNTK